MREGHQGLAESFSCCCYSLFAFYLESETLVTFYLESESSFVSTFSVNSGSYSQFLKRAVSRKYSKIWFRFTSEIKVEQENYHNESNFCTFTQLLSSVSTIVDDLTFNE